MSTNSNSSILVSRIESVGDCSCCCSTCCSWAGVRGGANVFSVVVVSVAASGIASGIDCPKAGFITIDFNSNDGYNIRPVNMIVNSNKTEDNFFAYSNDKLGLVNFMYC